MRKEFEKSIELAYALFDPNYELRCNVFSFGFYKSRLIVVGRNQAKTHSINVRNPLRFRDSGKIYYEKNLCAEADLFLKVKNTTNIPFSKLKIFNVRVDRNGQIKNSKPCLSCSNLITYVNPRCLYYTTDAGCFEEYA